MKLDRPALVRFRTLIAFYIALSSWMSSAIYAQGVVVSWGFDWNGEVLDTPSETAFVQVAGGFRCSLAIRADGSITGWPAWHPSVASRPHDSGYVQVAAGVGHALALRTDGSIISWGDDTYGQVSDTPSGALFTQVDAGGAYSLALSTGGLITAWGLDDSGQVSGSPIGPGFLQVAAGAGHALALRADGSIVSWGWDSDGQVSNTPSETGFTQIAAGGIHSLALRADGSIVSWGQDVRHQVTDTPTGTGFVQLAGGGSHSLALHSDGSITSWGSDFNGLVTNSPGGTGFTQVSGGVTHSLALAPDNNGYAFCTGDGTADPCPCGASAGPGEGCMNSSMTHGARLSAQGNASESGGEFILQVSGVPGNKPGLLLRGHLTQNSGLGNPIGDGLFCVGGLLMARSQVQVTSGGVTTFTDFQGDSFASSNCGIAVATYYQFWYRDPANTCSGTGFNFTNAWGATWMP